MSSFFISSSKVSSLYLNSRMYDWLSWNSSSVILSYFSTVCRCNPSSWAICAQRRPFDFNSLTLYHITSFFCEPVSPCASIVFVFVVIYKGMDAFVFLGHDGHLTLPKYVHFALPKIVDSKLPITSSSSLQDKKMTPSLIKDGVTFKFLIN